MQETVSVLTIVTATAVNLQMMAVELVVVQVATEQSVDKV
jgi:hypothetical protein